MKMNGSWKDNSAERSFCKICKGEHYRKDNSTRQAAVRAAMQEANWPNSELPNDCAGSADGSCSCQYSKH